VFSSIIAEYMHHSSVCSLFINKDPVVIYDKGRKAMVDTKAAHTAGIASRPAAAQQMMFCETMGDLVEQMGETCFYHAKRSHLCQHRCASRAGACG
jgi:hypothetical protein